MVSSVISSLIGPASATPATPPGLWAIPGDGRATMTWGGAVGATGYNLYRSTDAVTYALHTSVHGTTFTDTGLTDG